MDYSAPHASDGLSGNFGNEVQLERMSSFCKQCMGTPSWLEVPLSYATCAEGVELFTLVQPNWLYLGHVYPSSLALWMNAATLRAVALLYSPAAEPTVSCQLAVPCLR